MLNEKNVPTRWRWTIASWLFVLLLMACSFVAGAAVSAFASLALVAPVASAGFAVGVAGLASSGLTSTLHSLYAGDSETRLATLQQLEQVFFENPSQLANPQLAEMLLPALRQCQNDPDRQVVLLANQLSDLIELGLTP